MQHGTFCSWRQNEDSRWRRVSGALIDDGAEEMLALLAAGPTGYKEWAEAYYEVSVSLADVTEVFSHLPLTNSVISRLNPDAPLDAVYADAKEIGFPSTPV